MQVQSPLIFLLLLLIVIPTDLLAQSSIHIGERRRGSLTKTDKHLDEDGTPFDWYQLEAKGGQRIKVELESKSFDPYLVLLDRDGTEITSCPGVRTGRPARIELTLPYSGRYHIRVNSLHKKGLGRYWLKIE